ncbi:antibiotic biosynthesis monooxygenase family protein [Nocardia gipuzkoensis]|uniref:antibiotic biosynthesis monooxygenase family protein n=1 Tax=Nocardia gipuzkoensis TaxID=2749991 RepID=UPI0015EEB22C|nr:antibiotic biosynthesis monooxygenase family protein [Nocardia gipuzkoensis]
MTDDGVTFINVFEIPAEQIDEFVENWHERARIMRTAPGFRDVRLHRALLPDTRFQLVNVAHWDSAEACEAAGAHSAVLASVADARKTADANPALYEVVAEYN